MTFAGALFALLALAVAPSGVAQGQEGGSVIPVWRSGRIVDTTTIHDAPSQGLLVVDLGEAWVPYVLSGTANQPHAYEPVFRKLARGEFPDDLQGHRAQLDRYLELYGIPPTLGVLRERFHAIALSDCRAGIDLETLAAFDGTALREDDEAPLIAEASNGLTELVHRLFGRQNAFHEEELDLARLTVRERRLLRVYGRATRWRQALAAIRQRLACEGHLRGRMPTGPELDRKTRAAIAEFERAHRIYSRGSLSGATLRALQTEPLELMRRDVVRALVERVQLAAGIIEDGSAVQEPDGSVRTFLGADGNEIALRDLEQEVWDRVVDSFGLDTPEATIEWLGRLGELSAHEHLFVAIPGPELPEYYAPDMDLFVRIDRGDVWYDFPFDEHDRPIPQPVENLPTLTLYTRYRGQEVPLVRWPTTIGGWRLERVNGEQAWMYKESPVGERVWAHVVSAPVWLPPRGTPPESLVTQMRRNDEGELVTELNLNLVGPGYASAYGLVAAYHRRFARRDGRVLLGTDEGIRTHGSVDYTSIWRRASHGCHRLHNHLAVRLFNFLLLHKPHRRQGHRGLDYRMPVRIDGLEDVVRIQRTGYFFALLDPVEVDVLPGRILGRSREPIREPIPVDPAERRVQGEGGERSSSGGEPRSPRTRPGRTSTETGGSSAYR